MVGRVGGSLARFIRSFTRELQLVAVYTCIIKTISACLFLSFITQKEKQSKA